MRLPEAFIADITPYLSGQELEDFCRALTETEQTTCVRINKAKTDQLDMEGQSPIGWNLQDGRYLEQRPNFTLDPLMHAGCYYVQEASSQFITHVVRHLIDKPVTALDLCAAPGGKSTAVLSALPQGSCLLSNEIDRRRARILAENVTKWGNPNVIVTSNAPADIAKLHQQFDLIITDVPCSGEGMFRKDEGAVKDWSQQKVSNCVKLQHEIVETIWPRLKPGGLLIYSTCTFNVHEDEEMLKFICNELGGTALEIPVEASWNIHPPLTGNHPCYRFMPHYTKGEGLFMAVIRKDEQTDTFGEAEKRQTSSAKTGKKNKGNDTKTKAPVFDLKKNTPALLNQLSIHATIELTAEGSLRAIPDELLTLHNDVTSQNLFMLQSGIEMGTIKGKDLIPAHALALSTARKEEAFPKAELPLSTALDYLRHEAIVLPETAPRGYVLLTYQQHALGFVKNLGNRCNSLYPQEWRIRFL